MTQPPDRCAALGFRVHSGWAWLVVLAGPLVLPTIADRRRIEIADPGNAGSRQPYHSAGGMNLIEAERHVAACVERSTRLAEEAVQMAIIHAQQEGYKISTSGVLTGSGKPIPVLEKILASHPLLHTAEGELFRNVIIAACNSRGLPVLGVKEKELPARSTDELGMTEAVIQQNLARMGKTISPPWQQDQKSASLVAWMALAAEARTTPVG